MARPAPPVCLSPRQRAILERLASSRTSPAWLVQRARFVLLSDEGVSGTEQARILGTDGQRARRWRRRWSSAASKVDDAEAGGASEKDLEDLITSTLADAPRSGMPPKFSAEQVAALISLACEPPQSSGLPITHWTPTELAEEARKRGIVESISPRHLDRLLKRGRPSSA